MALCCSDPRHERQQLKLAKGGPTEGTCEWVASTKQYKDWFCNQSSSLLWVIGGPGKGKTIISIFLAEKLLEIAQNTPGTIILQNFCGIDRPWNDAISVVRGYLYQLLDENEGLFLSHFLRPYQVQIERMKEARDAPMKDDFLDNFEVLWELFITMIRKQHPMRVYCIIDGFDECNDSSVKTLLSAFKRITNDPSSNNFKLLIVSRPLSRNIPNSLQDSLSIDLDSEFAGNVETDLQIHVKTQIFMRYPAKTETDIWREKFVQNILTKADGTFLWTGFAMGELDNKTPAEADESIGSLPPGLDAMYERELERIPVERRETCHLMLKWITCATRPLTLIELFEAVEMKCAHPQLRENEINEYIARCGYILAVTGKTVGLVHKTARDYLLSVPGHNLAPTSFRINEKKTHGTLTQRCVEYLQTSLQKGPVLVDKPHNRLSLEVPTKVDTIRLAEYPLLSYSVLEWPTHARLADSDTFTSNTTFFTEGSQTFIRWLESFDYVRCIQVPVRLDRARLIDIAAYLGISGLVENIAGKKNRFTRRRMLNAEIKERTCLSFAAANGHEETVRLLYDMGAVLNTKDGIGRKRGIIWAPLSYAAYHGHTSMVQLLLDLGAKIDCRCSINQTPLHLAALGGHPDVVKVLLTKTTVVESDYDSINMTPLLYAARGGHTAVVQLLLGAGAPFDDKGQAGQTPLSSAAERGHKDTVQILLEKGAAVNSKDCWGITPLFYAVRLGHEDVVHLLLNAGAAIDTKCIWGQSLLSYAAESGKLAIVQLFLDKKLSVDSRDALGRTPLSYAAEAGSLDIVQLLLDTGATIDSKCQKLLTPLSYAIQSKRINVVQLLLENGASIRSKDRVKMAPLLAAAKQDNLP